MNTNYMEQWKWQQLLWTAGFLGITYIPLQCVAIWKCRSVARLAAALPLLVVIPMIYGAIQQLNYHAGSLFGMYFVFLYLPAMIPFSTIETFGQLPRSSIRLEGGGRVQAVTSRLEAPGIQ